MKRITFLLFCMLLSIIAYSQEDNKSDSIKVQQLANQNEYKGLEPFRPELMYLTSLEFGDEELAQEASRKIRLAIFAYDCKLQSGLQNSLLSSKRLTYSFEEYSFDYSIGKYHQGDVQMHFEPSDKLNIDIGGSVVQYNILYARYNDILFNFDATYQFNNWLGGFVYGQYSVNSVRNSRNGGYMFSPQNKYGGGVNIKTSENVSFLMGVERIFNPFSRKWNTNSLFSPKIRFR